MCPVCGDAFVPTIGLMLQCISGHRFLLKITGMNAVDRHVVFEVMIVPLGQEERERVPAIETEPGTAPLPDWLYAASEEEA